MSETLLQDAYIIRAAQASVSKLESKLKSQLHSVLADRYSLIEEEHSRTPGLLPYKMIPTKKDNVFVGVEMRLAGMQPAKLNSEKIRQFVHQATILRDPILCLRSAFPEMAVEELLAKFFTAPAAQLTKTAFKIFLEKRDSVTDETIAPEMIQRLQDIEFEKNFVHSSYLIKTFKDEFETKFKTLNLTKVKEVFDEVHDRQSFFRDIKSSTTFLPALELVSYLNMQAINESLEQPFSELLHTTQVDYARTTNNLIEAGLHLDELPVKVTPAVVGVGTPEEITQKVFHADLAFIKNESLRESFRQTLGPPVATQKAAVVQ